MVNNFRRKGMDTLIAFLLIWVITLPLIIIMLDKFPHLIEKLAVIACVTLYNGSISLIITTALYTNYIASLDNGVKINDFKILNGFMHVLLILIYFILVFFIIYDPESIKGSFSSFCLFPVLAINTISRPSIVIGDTYITNSHQTARLDSIVSVSEGKSKSLNGVSRISLELKDNKRMVILGSDKVYRLVCQKVENLNS